MLEALCDLFPQADLFTLFYDPDAISDKLLAHRCTASFLQPFRKHYRTLLPLMPLALEQFDLRGYDLILSSESGPAKGVLALSDARHICYCHTPMRYLWDLYPAYRKEWTTSRLQRLAMAPFAHYLRMWDTLSAGRVDEFIANSRNVQSRIRRAYGRESSVLYPPVAVDQFYWNPSEDFYLIVAELVPYKRLDHAVRVFSRSGRRLKIVGDGPEYRRLRELASPNIEFCGRLPDSELRELYSRCRAFLMPGEEDFGMTAVEALASGKPVIGFARGGALEIVPGSDASENPWPLGGLLYPTQDEDSLSHAIEAWDRVEPLIQPQELQQYARRFSVDRFQDGMRATLGLAGASARPSLREKRLNPV